MARAKKPSPTQNPSASDIIVVGGGLAGMTLAALLGAKEIPVTCLDRDPVATATGANYDLRTTAISYGSHLVLKEAGIWDALKKDACPIEDIRILDGSSPVLLNFLSSDLEGEPFGWIVNNRDLRLALAQRLKALPHVRHLAPAMVTAFDVTDAAASVVLSDGVRLAGRLIVGADGKHSAVRKFINAPLHGWMYGQAAIVCVVGHTEPHHNCAIEHFRPEGPFAVLPMTDAPDGTHRSSLVWSVDGDGQRQIAWDDATFNLALQARFPKDYGTVKALGPRAAWPLGLQHAHTYIAPRIALVAEAAHAMHPIAGQGLNMGLRDVAELAALVETALGADQDPGAASLLATYQRRRHFDNMAMMAATDALTRLFSNRLPLISPLRKLGVALVQKISPARHFFMRQAMGTAGLVPELMKKTHRG